MGGCCAVNCSNNIKKGFRMFRFPRDEGRMKKWVQNSRRDKWTPTRHSVLCESHFEASQFEQNRLDGRQLLRPDAVPTIFNVPNPPKTFDSKRKSVYKKPVDLLNSALTEDENAISSGNDSAKPLCEGGQSEPIIACDDAFHVDESQSRSRELSLKKAIDNLQASMTATRNELEKKIVGLQLELATCHEKLQRFLTEDQILSLDKMKMREWSSETIIKALKFRFMLGVHGYKFLHESGYPIPSYSTLNRRLSNFSVSPGILMDLLEPLKYKVQCMEPEDRFCVISIDEMQINSTVDYQPHLKRFLGFVSLGETASKSLGTHILLVLVRGLRTNWKQIVACEVTSSETNSEHVSNFLIRCIKYVEDCGLRVVSFSSDMGSMNVGIWRKFNVFARKDGSTNNFFSVNGHNVYAVPDTCHLLKNLKNAMLNQDMSLPTEVVNANHFSSGIISSKFIKHLWHIEVSEKKVIRSLAHIQRKDLYPTNFEKMHVGPAVRFFSLKTAAAISLAISSGILPAEASATAWFIKQVALWFEMLSARQRKKTITKRNKGKKIEFLVSFISLFRALRWGNSWKPLNSGIVLSTLSICDVCEILFKIPGFDFVYTHRFNQDSIENCFSQIRRRAGATPTVGQCLAAIKIISVAQFVSEVSRSSYFSASDEFLIDHFSREERDKSKVSNALVVLSREETPDFGSPFETIQICSNHEYFDLNLLFYIAGACLNALLKNGICDTCKELLDSSEVPEDFSYYVNVLNKGGLKKPNVHIFTLIVNCEIIYNKFLQYILRNNHKDIMDKIARDIDVILPVCHECGDLKYFIIQHFFKIRSFGVVSQTAAIKRRKEMYGTASVKKRKIS